MISSVYRRTSSASVRCIVVDLRRCALLITALCVFLATGEAQQLDLYSRQTASDWADAPSVITAASPVLELNRFTFSGNVLRPGDHAENWVVIFCADWFEPCQEASKVFERVGEQLQGQLNTDLMSLKVRFASVDCAGDKSLCNQEAVQSYPTIVHYQRGQRRGSWEGMDAKQLRKWILQELTGLTPELAATSGGAGIDDNTSNNNAQAVDVALIVAAVLGSLLLVSGNPGLKTRMPFLASASP